MAAFLRPPLQLGSGLAAIVLAHSILAYPFVVRAVVPVLEGLDRRVVEAARSLGATRLRAFRDIELPLIRRGLLVGAVFAFAISLGEMSATIMLARPELKTMPGWPPVEDDPTLPRFGGGPPKLTVVKGGKKK